MEYISFISLLSTLKLRTFQIVCRVDTNLSDEIDPVWCFLENVRDHSNPQSGCFSDTTWSSRDGRFWSSEACEGLPPISDEGIDELPVSSGVPLEQVPWVPGHMLRLDNGCHVPILRTIFSLKIYQFRENYEK